MSSRRDFLVTALASIGATAGLSACSSETYGNVVDRTWRHGPLVADDKGALLRELVRYATLAPSSHNTQCWKFHLADDAISLLPDLARRCPAVDPDDHHLFVSLGCAAENLIQAALAHGFNGHADFDAAGGNVLRVALAPTRPVASTLFQAIPARQSTRGEYDGQPLAASELELLARAGRGNGVGVILLTERQAMEKVLEYVVQGNTAQMNDPAFVAELKKWIRFSTAEAVQTGDGLYTSSSGNPAVPTWLGSLLFGLFFTPQNENDKYAKQLRSSAGIAIFVSDTPGPMGGGRPLLRAFRAAVGGLGDSQRADQPAGRGRVAAPAVRRFPGDWRTPARSCRAFRARPEIAFLTASTGAGGAGLSSRIG